MGDFGEIETAVTKILRFVERFRKIGNGHMVEFFAKKHFEYNIGERAKRN